MSGQSEFAVIGTAFGDPKRMIIRRHASHEAAAEHTLRLDLSKWDDVWVEPIAPLPPSNPEPTVAPPFPWNVLWVGGHSYVVDATGKKIASLLGSQKQREFVAEIICDLQVSA